MIGMEQGRRLGVRGIQMATRAAVSSCQNDVVKSNSWVMLQESISHKCRCMITDTSSPKG
jgi:hypothetical protein